MDKKEIINDKDIKVVPKVWPKEVSKEEPTVKPSEEPTAKPSEEPTVKRLEEPTVRPSEQPLLVVPELKSKILCQWEVIRYYLYFALKWFQVFVCLLTVIIGVFFEITFLSTGKKAWRNYNLDNADKPPPAQTDKCECNLTIMSLRFWWDVIIWLFIELSIPGAIGAAAEIMSFQCIYAVASIPVFPYCLIPWIVYGGQWRGWTTPPEILRKS